MRRGRVSRHLNAYLLHLIILLGGLTTQLRLLLILQLAVRFVLVRNQPLRGKQHGHQPALNSKQSLPVRPRCSLPPLRAYAFTASAKSVNPLQPYSFTSTSASEAVSLTSTGVNSKLAQDSEMRSWYMRSRRNCTRMYSSSCLILFCLSALAVRPCAVPFGGCRQRLR